MTTPEIREVSLTKCNYLQKLKTADPHVSCDNTDHKIQTLYRQQSPLRHTHRFVHMFFLVIPTVPAHLSYKNFSLTCQEKFM